MTTCKNCIYCKKGLFYLGDSDYGMWECMKNISHDCSVKKYLGVEPSYSSCCRVRFNLASENCKSYASKNDFSFLQRVKAVIFGYKGNDNG